MRDTVVVNDEYVYGKPPAAGSSIVRTLFCGAPLFSDPKRRPSGKLKSTQFCSYTALPTCSKRDKTETAEELPEATKSTFKNHSDSLEGCSIGKSMAKYQYSEQKRSASMFEMDHRPGMNICYYEPDQMQQYYEKLMCQLTMSNSALMRENQRHQIRFKHLRMLLEDHIDHLNNIYYTLFLNGFNALQFPSGRTVNLAEFHGTELKLIPRICKLPVDILPTIPDEDLFAMRSPNNNDTFAFSDVWLSEKERENTGNSRSTAGESSLSFSCNNDNDHNLLWPNERVKNQELLRTPIHNLF